MKKGWVKDLVLSKRQYEIVRSKTGLEAKVRTKSKEKK